jgi:hypothetical protein
MHVGLIFMEMIMLMVIRAGNASTSKYSAGNYTITLDLSLQETKYCY